MRKSTIIGLFGLLLVLAACQTEIDSFEECVAAGNPVMESYPRQCRANGETFVEEIEEPVKRPSGMAEFTECTEQPEVCTQQYDPVCALVDNSIRCVTEPCPSFNAVTKGNGCVACSDNSLGYYEGSCEEQTFVVCKETVTGFSAEEFAENNNGICVDVCPGNYDAYTTQIGVELCIEHYGVEDIETWPVCERSSESCSCVKAYETTTGESIEEAEYRCVPERYEERLLFRAGVDRLDENGEQSVVIA